MPEVVALADPVASSIEWGLGCVEAGPGGADASVRVATYADHRDLLAEPNVDAVVIASPNHTHVAVLPDVSAPQARLVEKPLCTTVEDCLAVRRGRRPAASDTWVGMEYRFMPPPRRCSSRSPRASVGRPRWCRSASTGSRSSEGGRLEPLHANTGGTLVEKCCHFFDLMNLVAARVRCA